MLQINEIFQSISGEAGCPSFPQGTFCSFIRFQKCNLACNWCDTKQSWNPNAGQNIQLSDILEAVKETNNIVITGGEPQVQQFGLSVLVRHLVALGKKIQIETNGSFMPVNFGAAVTWVMDYKLPSSGMDQKMLTIFSFYQALRKGNVALKFVFDDQEDIALLLERVQGLVNMADIHHFDFPFASFILSPTENGRQYSKELVEKIFENNLQEYCIFSLQSHKILDLK